MSNTINSIIEECVNYRYSKEYYDLYKSCSKINLMEKFIDMQLYNDVDNELDNYYMESVDDNSLNAIIMEAEEVKESTWEKLKKGFNKILEYARQVLTILMENNDKTLKAADALVKKLNGATIDEDSTKKIANMLDATLKSIKGFDPWLRDQPFAKNINCKFVLSGGDSSKVINTIRARLGAALSNDIVKIAPIKIQNKSYGSIDFNSILNLIFEFVDDKMTVQQFSQQLQGMYKKTSIDGMTIYVSSKSNKELLKKIGQVRSILDEYKKANTNISKVTENAEVIVEANKGNQTKNQAQNGNKVQKSQPAKTNKSPVTQQKTTPPNKNNNGAPVNKGSNQPKQGNKTNSPKTTNPAKLNLVYTVIKEIMGTVIQIYSSYIKYRRVVINKLNKIINEDATQPKETQQPQSATS